MQERTNEQWLAELRGPNPDKLLADLYGLLVRGLRAALGGRADGADANIGDYFAQEALIKIVSNLDSFRGESRFTTWAKKTAMNVALTELKRRRWRDVSLQDLLDRRTATGRGLADPQLTGRSGISPGPMYTSSTLTRFDISVPPLANEREVGACPFFTLVDLGPLRREQEPTPHTQRPVRPPSDVAWADAERIHRHEAREAMARRRLPR